MSYPILKQNSSWFTPNVDTITRNIITIINIVDSYTPSGNETDSWDASIAQDGSIMCYVEDTVLTIAGNGSVKIMANEDSSYMFYDINKEDSFSSLTELNGLSLIDTTNVTTFEYSFYNCAKLSSIDLSAWDVSKCESIYYMFSNCTNTTSINLTGWDIPNMKNIGFAFNSCSSLTSLDVSNWNTSNVTNMKAVFNTCGKLESIDVSNWNTSNVTNMEGMFNKCSSLTTLDVSNFNVSNVTSIRLMFQSCSSLQSIDVSKWDTSNITNMGFVFWGCNKLTSIPLENWDVSNVESFDHIFAHCKNLVVDVAKWKPSNKCKFYDCMFHSIANTYLDVSGFDTSGAISMFSMFEACTKLEKIDGLQNFDTSNCHAFEEMFRGCYVLKELDLSSFDTRKADSDTPSRSDSTETSGSRSQCTWYMFNFCRCLEKITLGENFTFAGDGTSPSKNHGWLEARSADYISGADGNWYTIDGTAYAPTDIPNLTAATYYGSPRTIEWEKNSKKYMHLAAMKTYHDLLNTEIDTKLDVLKEEIGNVEDITSEDIQFLFK